VPRPGDTAQPLAPTLDEAWSLTWRRSLDVEPGQTREERAEAARMLFVAIHLLAPEELGLAEVRFSRIQDPRTRVLVTDSVKTLRSVTKPLVRPRILLIG
jgi:hypothetical protein